MCTAATRGLVGATIVERGLCLPPALPPLPPRGLEAAEAARMRIERRKAQKLLQMHTRPKRSRDDRVHDNGERVQRRRQTHTARDAHVAREQKRRMALRIACLRGEAQQRRGEALDADKEHALGLSSRRSATASRRSAGCRQGARSRTASTTANVCNGGGRRVRTGGGAHPRRRLHRHDRVRHRRL